MAITSVPLPHSRVANSALLVFLAAAIVLGVAVVASWIAPWSGSDSPRDTVAVAGTESPTQPIRLTLFWGTQEGLDAATWMNGGTFDNVVLIQSAEDEARILRFVETANSYLLAGGLPGYEVDNLKP